MLSSSRKARTEAMLLSGRRFSSLYGGTVQPSPMQTAALPTINNYILQKHIDAVHTLQQQMLERELQCKTAGVLMLDEEPEDDAPLPSTRYSHMSDLLLPEQEPETFEAWKAGMEQRLAQQQQQQQHRPQQKPDKQQQEQPPVAQLPEAVKQ